MRHKAIRCSRGPPTLGLAVTGFLCTLASIASRNYFGEPKGESYIYVSRVRAARDERQRGAAVVMTAVN